VKLNKAPERLVDLPQHELETIKKEAQSFSLETINQLFQTLFEEEQAVRLASQPKLAVEMALIALAQLNPIVSIETIIEKLDMLQKTAGDINGGSESVNMVREPAKKDLRIPTACTSHSLYSHANKMPEGDLQNIWKALLKVFEQRYPSLAPCLEKCVLQCIEKEKLTIAINGSSFHANRLQDKKDIIESVCSDFFKQKISVAMITSLPNGTQDTERETDYNRHLKKEALNNPVVMETLEVFGGRVVDVKLL
jgi:DNA polymerase-3 subunit gamma/tau